MVIEDRYYEKLIDKFCELPELGIASGAVYVDGRPEKRSPAHPAGGCRLFRRQCFEDVGGYQVYPSPFAGADSIAKVKAQARGWRVGHFADLRADQLRPTGGVEGAWKSARHRANVMWYYDYPPLLMLGACLSLMTRRPHYHAAAFALTYLGSLIRRPERIPDDEVRSFVRREKWREIRSNLGSYFGG